PVPTPGDEQSHQAAGAQGGQAPQGKLRRLVHRARLLPQDRYDRGHTVFEALHRGAIFGAGRVSRGAHAIDTTVALAVATAAIRLVRVAKVSAVMASSGSTTPSSSSRSSSRSTACIESRPSSLSGTPSGIRAPSSRYFRRLRRIPSKTVSSIPPSPMELIRPSAAG